MRMLKQVYCFYIYGCIGTIISTAQYVAALFDRYWPPMNVWIVEILFIFHGAAYFFTFGDSHSNPKWKPIITINPLRIKIAKIVLILAAANYALPLVLSLFLKYPIYGDKTPFLLLSSFILLNTIYIAIHWALRPENIFSAAFLRFMSNPLFFFLRRRN